MSNYWMSWCEPGDDYRPLTLPLPAAIRGWWCSGYDSDDNATLCALVKAESEDDAKALICQFWKPGYWRFCEERGDDWLPGDRFPLEAQTHD